MLERGESIIALKDQITQLLDQNPEIDDLKNDEITKKREK